MSKKEITISSKKTTIINLTEEEVIEAIRTVYCQGSLQKATIIIETNTLIGFCVGATITSEEVIHAQPWGI